MSGKKNGKERYSFDELKRECAGQWPTIIGALSVADISDAMAKIGKHTVCPVDHGDNYRRFRLFKDFAETGGGICSRCDSFPDGFALLTLLNGWDRKTAVKEVANFLRDRGYKPSKTRKPPPPPKPRPLVVNKRHTAQLEKLWSEALPIEGTIVEKYLRSRGIDGELPNTGDVGFHPRVKYWDPISEKSLGHFPAMVSVVRSSQSGHPLSIHRIYLDPTGRKADVPDAKKLMPCSVEGAMGTAGAAVRLYQLDGDEMAITEGLETAMAIRCAHPNLPVWAAVSAPVLTSFKPPASVKRVYIFGDVDKSGTGQAVGARLALRLQSEGIEAKLCLPAKEFALPPHGSGQYTKKESLAAVIKCVRQAGYTLAMSSPQVDWNDVWQASREVVVNAVDGPPTTH